MSEETPRQESLPSIDVQQMRRSRRRAYREELENANVDKYLKEYLLGLIDVVDRCMQVASDVLAVEDRFNMYIGLLVNRSKVLSDVGTGLVEVLNTTDLNEDERVAAAYALAHSLELKRIEDHKQEHVDYYMEKLKELNREAVGDMTAPNKLTELINMDVTKAPEITA